MKSFKIICSALKHLICWLMVFTSFPFRDRSSLEPVNSLLRAGAPGPQAGRFRRDDRQLDEVGA